MADNGDRTMSEGDTCFHEASCATVLPSGGIDLSVASSVPVTLDHFQIREENRVAS